MGIKGIYAQLGPGRRVSLSKLAADNFRDSGRPLRLAIDFAIWQFQAQAARGGTNPAIRTLFYRLVRLLGTPVQPVFVFDGPNKPVFKRNKRSGRGDGVAVSQAKRLIRLFGFPVHDAPGEAEAECALLQKRGIVDAVLSEDVDTIMFGCTRTLRNWSAEGKSSKTPTHVSLYDVGDMKLANLGLDREGMVLVALMSGGDYLPDGIPGCGVKVACEAAKAGFGKKVCRLRTSDKDGVRKWRESLIHELRTNESKYFRTKHKALTIPDDFPNLEVLRYYTHPVVSPDATMDSIQQRLGQKRGPQLETLREFARETFGWDYRLGAIKFIRVLGSALLVDNMQHQRADDNSSIKRISGRRTHFSTDGESELRLSYIPAEVVPLDLSQEVEENIPASREGLALNSDEEYEAPDDAGIPRSSEPELAKAFDVTKPDLAWVLEDFVSKTAPKAFAAWEEAQNAKAARKSPKKKKGTTAKSTKETGLQRGALDKFVRITKAPPAATRETLNETTGNFDKSSAKDPTPSKPSQPPTSFRMPSPSPPREPSKQPTSSDTSNPVRPPADDWTSARSQVSPTRTPKRTGVQEAVVISSSPAGPSSLPASPSPRPRAPPACTQKVLAPVRPGLPSSQGSQGVKATKQATRGRITTAKTMPGSQSSPDGRYKQTSMDMFTTRMDPFVSSQTSNAQPHTDHYSEANGSLSADEDCDADLPGLSLSRLQQGPASPRSPTKRQKSPPESRESSPMGATKKKLLVPRTSAVGYFKEVEVEAEERDGVAARETRRLEAKGAVRGAVRWSDVSFVDLTNDA